MLKKFLIGTFVVFALAFAMSASAAYDFGPTTLKVGSTGQYVMNVQTVVGAVPVDGIFGPGTKAKVMAWQASNGLVADGIVGPATKNAMNAGSYSGTTCLPGQFDPMTGLPCGTSSNLPAGCTSTAGFSPTTGASCAGGTTQLPAGCLPGYAFSSTTGLSCTGTTPVVTGGAGTVESYTLVASLSNEEVGEGTDDTKVYGIEIEAGEGSDIALTAVKLDFAQGTATSNFKDYADEVTVWLGSTKVATVDSSKFTDDNGWIYTASLSGATISSGDTENLYVAISGVDNLDTNDATDTWTLDITSIRWVDGSGAMIAEDPTLAARTFSFESVAVATDLEFKISSDDSTVNDAHILDIHATQTVSNIPIASFKVKIEGTGDVKLKDLPVNYDVTTQDNIDEMVEGLSLWMDGEEVSTVNMTSDCVEDSSDCTSVGTDETYIFHDIDTVLESGKTYHFLVKADIYGLTDTGDVAAGDTIQVTLGETQTNLSSFDAEDLTGTNLADGDKTGSLTAAAHEVRDVGISVALVGTPTAVKTAGNAQATQSDSGLFTIVFDATAFGANMYIDATAPDASGGTTESDVDVTGAGTLLCTITSPSGATLSTSYLITQDETERFSVNCDIRDGATDLEDGFFDVALTNIAYAITDAQTVNIDYTFDLADFKTPQIFLDDNGA